MTIIQRQECVQGRLVRQGSWQAARADGRQPRDGGIHPIIGEPGRKMENRHV